MSKKNKLEKLLSERHFEPASTNLAERIIMTAKPHAKPAARKETIWSIFIDISFPRPAFTFALMLILGFTFGMENPLFQSSSDDSEQESASTFLDYDGDSL